jgi:DNA repair protein RecO (recombination protein O)
MAPPERVSKVEAIVISHRDFGEADRLVKVFTATQGKLTLLAKGARRIRSRKAAHLEPLTHAALVLAKGRTFWLITQADTLDQFQNIRENLAVTAEALYVLELVDLFTADGEGERSIYQAALTALKYLDAGRDPFHAVRYFELRIMDLAGFKPQLFTCVVCKNEIQPQDQYIGLREGGVLCPACGHLVQGAIRVSQDALKYLRHFQRSAFREIDGIPVPNRVRSEMAAVLQALISHHTERKIQSREVIRQIGFTAVKSGQPENDIQ